MAIPRGSVQICVEELLGRNCYYYWDVVLSIGYSVFFNFFSSFFVWRRISCEVLCGFV